MNRWIAGSIVLAVCMGVAGTARGQLIPAYERAQPAMLVAVSLDPQLVLDVGYLQPLPFSSPKFGLALGATVGSLVLLPPEPNLRGSLVALASVHGGAWRATCALQLALTHLEDDAGSMFAVGPGLRCQPALVVQNWAVGLDLGLQSAVTTHIEHSALARRTFDDRYPERDDVSDGPEDGWYAFAAQRVRLGLSAQAALTERWFAGFALGTLLSSQAQNEYFSFNFGQVPFYLELASRFGW